MTIPGVGIADIGLIALYALVLVLPGSVVGAVGVLRGSQLAVSAPLLTYAVAGLSGPWTSDLGNRWSVGATSRPGFIREVSLALARYPPRSGASSAGVCVRAAGARTGSLSSRGRPAASPDDSRQPPASPVRTAGQAVAAPAVGAVQCVDPSTGREITGRG